MHYIRFLKVPRVVDRYGDGRWSIDAKIAITTDLGESFLTSDVAIKATPRDPTGGYGPEHKARSFAWNGDKGMRALDISVPITGPRGCRQMLGLHLRTQEPNPMGLPNKFPGETVGRFDRVISKQGGIVEVYSAPVTVVYKTNPGTAAEAFAKRRFVTSTGLITIWEETGESIARHIWYVLRDAGLVLSAYLSQLSPHILESSPTIPPPFPRLPNLETLLKKKDLNILELGAGCGIVGLTLTHSLSANINKIILTDLPEASEILKRNLVPFTTSANTSSIISHEILDWSHAKLPENIASTSWDLVLIADCTYNPDVVPDLVSTLGRVREGNEGKEKKDVMVLLAMKVRHESEKVFFELMDDAGWGVGEKAVLGLGMFGGGDGDGDDDEEGEEVEIYVFGEKELGRGKRRRIK